MSLENVLKPEYRLALHLNAATTIHKFCDDYLDDNKYTRRFRRKWGERYLGEIPPKLIQDQKIWDTPVSENRLSPEILYALNDPDFHKVMKKVEPDYKIDLDNVTAGLLIRLSHAQHLGMTHQLAHKKKTETGAFIEKLNDTQAYVSVKNNIKRIFPELLPYLPDKPYQFKLKAYQKNIVKEIDSSWRKMDNYMPTENNQGQAGLFGIKDPLRITIVTENNENPTWNDRIAQRNQIFAFTLSLGMDLNFIKDHISNAALSPHKALHWPCCMFHGKQYYPLNNDSTNKIYVGLSQEIQFAPLSPKNEHYKETTVQIRKNVRCNQGRKIKDGSDKAHAALTLEMWKKTLPNLYQAVQNQQPDPSYTLILQFLAEKKHVTEHGKNQKHMVDLSGSSSLKDTDSNILTTHTLKTMIQPYRLSRRS